MLFLLCGLCIKAGEIWGQVYSSAPSVHHTFGKSSQCTKLTTNWVFFFAVCVDKCIPPLNVDVYGTHVSMLTAIVKEIGGDLILWLSSKMNNLDMALKQHNTL